MNKVYNTQSDISSKIFNFLSNNVPSLHKPQLKFIPSVVFGMIMSESIVSSDIARQLKEEFSLVQLDSITRRLRRLLNNPRFDGYLFYHQIISSLDLIKYMCYNHKGGYFMMHKRLVFSIFITLNILYFGYFYNEILLNLDEILVKSTNFKFISSQIFSQNF